MLTTKLGVAVVASPSTSRMNPNDVDCSWTVATWIASAVGANELLMSVTTLVDGLRLSRVPIQR